MPCETVINPVVLCEEEEAVSEASPCSVVDDLSSADINCCPEEIIGGGVTDHPIVYTGEYTITEVCDCPYTGSDVIITETAISYLSQTNADAMAYAKAIIQSQLIPPPVCTINYSLLQGAINNRRTSPYVFTQNTLAELITAFSGIDQTSFYILNANFTVYNSLRYSAGHFIPTTADNIYTFLRLMKHKYTGESFINPLITSTFRQQMIDKGLWYSDQVLSQGVFYWLSLATRGAGTFTQGLNIDMESSIYPYGGRIILSPIGPPFVSYSPAFPEWASFNTDVMNAPFTKTYDWPGSTNFYAPSFSFFHTIYSSSFINDLASPFYGANPKVTSVWVSPGEFKLRKNNGVELTDSIYTLCT